MFSTSNLQAIVCVCRLKEAEEFYGGALGLALKGRSLSALVYQVGGSLLRVSPVPSMQRSDHTVIGFEVSDVQAAIGYLRDRGVALERFDNFSQDHDGILRIPDGTQVAWFRDPDGNLLSVVQYASEDGIERRISIPR